MAGVKPRVGDLVKLNQEIVDAKGYSGPAVGDIGVIVKCIGIRCHVSWARGANTTPERSVLEIVNAAR